MIGNCTRNWPFFLWLSGRRCRGKECLDVSITTSKNGSHCQAFRRLFFILFNVLLFLFWFSAPKSYFTMRLCVRIIWACLAATTARRLPTTLVLRRRKTGIWRLSTRARWPWSCRFIITWMSTHGKVCLDETIEFGFVLFVFSQLKCFIMKRSV